MSYRNAFYALGFILLVLLPLLSIDSGVSGDEHLHYAQSEKVYDYLRTCGEDRSALDTPHSHLKYYGQSFDNLVTLVIKWFNIQDVYLFRHICNALAGWGTIFIAGLLLVLIAGYRAGFIALLLFALSPRFLGHSWNNLKDIPFALGYMAGIYFSFRVIRQLPKPSLKNCILLVLALAFTISVRIGGVLLVCYMFLFAGLYMGSNHLSGQARLTTKTILRSFLYLLAITILAYLLALPLWPFGLEAPLANGWLAFKAMSHFPTTLLQVFEGKVYWSEQLPWYYLPKYMLITIPGIVLVGLLAFIVFSSRIMSGRNWLLVFFLLIASLFPLIWIIITDANVYGAWRQVLFIYPPLLLLAALGFEWLFKHIGSRMLWIVTAIILLAFAVLPLRFMIRNHPYEYVYFNELAGGVRGAYGRYEMDYYFHSIREAGVWLEEHIKQEKIPGEESIVVGLNFPAEWAFREMGDKINMQYITYYERGNTDWEYAIIANSYIHPYQLQQELWPPDNTIHTIQVDGKPICAILAREGRDDLHGYLALQSGEYERADSLLSRVLETDPLNEAALINLSLACRGLGKLEAAIDPLNQCLEIYPDYEVAIYLLAGTHHLRGETETAIDLYHQNIEKNFKHFPSYTGIARVYLETGQDQLAIRSLHSCIRINPGYKPAYEILGEHYLKTGQDDLAKKYLDHAGKL